MAFDAAGFEPIAISCLQACPLDVSLHPAIVDFDRFSDVVVTSPETAHLLIDAILGRWTQWPDSQTFWAVGPGTAQLLNSEIRSVREGSEPGSSSLIEQMQREVHAQSRIIVASGHGSGRQFDGLNQLVDDPVVHLELFALESCLQPSDLDVSEITAIVHGSVALLKAFVDTAVSQRVDITPTLHFVTSSDAKEQLPSGSRYYQINAPTSDAVELAMQGEPSVKA